MGVALAVAFDWPIDYIKSWHAFAILNLNAVDANCPNSLDGHCLGQRDRLRSGLVICPPSLTFRRRSGQGKLRLTLLQTPCRHATMGNAEPGFIVERDNGRSARRAGPAIVGRGLSRTYAPILP